MPLTLRTLKRTALNGLRASGVYRLVENSSWRRNRLLILCYHGIAIEEEHRWRPSLFMSLPDFRSRLQVLERGKYNVLPLGEAVDRLYAGELPERSVAITFDDGNFDFYQQAFPLLREHGFPATVYLHSFYCINQYPIFRLICSYMLWRQRGGTYSTRTLTGTELEMDLRTEAGRNRVEQALMRHVEERGLPPEERDQVAAALAEVIGIDYAALRAKRVLQVMSPAEVAEVAAAGMQVELHTHRHYSPPEEALYREQIRENREVIESIVGRRPVHFCYPSGNHKPEFLPWLRAEEVVSATTCAQGIAHRGSDPLLLPRLVDHGGVSPLEFTGWLAGVADFLPKRHYVSRDA